MRGILAFALLPLLAACATPAGSGFALPGTQWTITAIDGQAPVAPDKARMHFDKDSLGAHVGCNGIGGAYRIDGSRLIAGPLIATQMFCDGPVWKQEEALNALLSAAPVIDRNGDVLRLSSAGHSAEMKRAAR